METTTQRGYAVPIAIIIAGILIAGAVAFRGGAERSVAYAGIADSRSDNPQSGAFRMPDENDHIRGNLDAAVTLVEFSDLECPFCARLHPTLARIVEENDDVAWIYRHFPLNSHTNAFSAAVASECIAILGGNDAFWHFVDSAFAGQRRLGDGFYKEFVRTAGIDATAFAACRGDRGVAARVGRDLDEVIAMGGRGTPYVVVIAASGELVPFSGALSYSQVSAVIENARFR